MRKNIYTYREKNETREKEKRVKIFSQITGDAWSLISKFEVSLIYSSRSILPFARIDARRTTKG